MINIGWKFQTKNKDLVRADERVRQTIKVINDRTRLKILFLLSTRKNVSVIQSLTQTSHIATHHDLTNLRINRMISAKHNVKYMYYALKD